MKKDWYPIVALGLVVSLFAVLTVVFATRGGQSTAYGVPRHRSVAALRVVDAAVKRGDVRAALRAWERAQEDARESPGWRPLVEAGDARLRIATLARDLQDARPRARQLYLTAVVRAREAGSSEGAIRAAEGLAAVGDRAALEYALRIAETARN